MTFYCYQCGALTVYVKMIDGAAICYDCLGIGEDGVAKASEDIVKDDLPEMR